jgi:hypothetical protein
MSVSAMDLVYSLPYLVFAMLCFYASWGLKHKQQYGRWMAVCLFAATAIYFVWINLGDPRFIRELTNLKQSTPYMLFWLLPIVCPGLMALWMSVSSKNGLLYY